MTTLSQHLDDYLAVRRSLGYDLSFSGRVLRGLLLPCKPPPLFHHLRSLSQEFTAQVGRPRLVRLGVRQGHVDSLGPEWRNLFLCPC